MRGYDYFLSDTLDYKYSTILGKEALKRSISMSKMSALFFILVVVSVFDFTTSTNTCTWGFYKCGSATQCIASRNRCDGANQCLNGQDERNCPSLCTGYYSRYFRCGNTVCISRNYLCNGFNNCNDGSDEHTSLCGGTVFPVRLVGGGSLNQGRVEVYYQYRWGTICDDDWGINDAIVVCRQLRLPRATRAVSGARFGQGTGPIYLDNVHCTGSELSLSKCSSGGWNNHNCGHNEDAGVVCGSGSTLPPTSVVRPNSCTWGNFRCSSSSRCVASRYRCDGTSQCPKGEDEASCPIRCSTSSQFRCNNYNCISRSYLCDNSNNCKDYSDESTALCGNRRSGSSLRCYGCSASTSSCSTSNTCSYYARYCYKRTYDRTIGGSTSRVTVRGCRSSCTSSDKITSCRGEKNCQISCCTTSLCNSGGGRSYPKCHTCFSSSSYKDCDDKSTLTMCSFSSSYCFKADLNRTTLLGGGHYYSKGCVESSSACSRKRSSLCNSITSSDCKVYCCSGSGCNGGSVQRCSVAVLLTCVVVFFLFL